MIDPIAAQILGNAVNFLFEEGKKILEERRERRKLGQERPNANALSQSTTNSLEDKTGESEFIQSKEKALSSIKIINETSYRESEMELKHLLTLFDTFKSNYYLAKEQYEMHGSAYVPPIIVHNLTEAEDGIAETTQKIQVLLTRIYEKKVMLVVDS